MYDRDAVRARSGQRTETVRPEHQTQRKEWVFESSIFAHIRHTRDSKLRTAA